MNKDLGHLSVNIFLIILYDKDFKNFLHWEVIYLSLVNFFLVFFFFYLILILGSN